jgi:hypothetical protein
MTPTSPAAPPHDALTPDPAHVLQASQAVLSALVPVLELLAPLQQLHQMLTQHLHVAVRLPELRAEVEAAERRLAELEQRAQRVELAHRTTRLRTALPWKTPPA